MLTARLSNPNTKEKVYAGPGKLMPILKKKNTCQKCTSSGHQPNKVRTDSIPSFYKVNFLLPLSALPSRTCYASNREGIVSHAGCTQSTGCTNTSENILLQQRSGEKIESFRGPFNVPLDHPLIHHGQAFDCYKFY